MNTEKFQSLIQDSAFMEKLTSCRNNEEIRALFDASGVALSDAEITRLVKAMKAAAENPESEGEISDDELGGVIGGADIASGLMSLVSRSVMPYIGQFIRNFGKKEQ